MRTPGNDKRRLLFLAQHLPYPPDTGAHIRTYNVLRQLARSFEVTLICFHRQDEEGTPVSAEARAEALSKLARVETFDIPQQVRRSRLLWDHLRSLVTSRVYTWYTYESSSFERRLRTELGAGTYDLVHVDSLDLSRFLDMARGLPVVLVHHDATSVQLKRRADRESETLRKWYLNRQALLMRREERKCALASLNVAVSDVDRALLQEAAGDSRFVVLPNGVDLEYFRPSWNSEVDGLVFVGGATWLPNRDALDYFCSDILPHVRAKRPDTTVTWVGRATDEDRASYRDRYGVELTGYVEDIRPYVLRAACCVIPIRIGSGTRVKILDAWAMGKAVVSTSIGAEGLDATSGEQLLLGDSAEDFAEAVLQVLDNPVRRSQLGRTGRAFVEDRYSWDAIGARMCNEYARLIPSSGA